MDDGSTLRGYLSAALPWLGRRLSLLALMLLMFQLQVLGMGVGLFQRMDKMMALLATSPAACRVGAASESAAEPIAIPQHQQ